jgi:hypothetical protein
LGVDRAAPAAFLSVDAGQVSFPDRAFDAKICLNALIPMLLDQQSGLISRIADWLRPGGPRLVTTGARAWTGTEERWLGGPVPMWWGQVDGRGQPDRRTRPSRGDAAA